MKHYTSIAILAALAFTGCSDSMNPAAPSRIKPSAQSYTQDNLAYDNASDSKIAAFKQEQRRVGLRTKKDPNYKSFGPVLTSEESKRWFNNQMFLLWDRQITRQQYIAQGVAKLPAYKHEFTFIAHNF